MLAASRYGQNPIIFNIMKKKIMGTVLGGYEGYFTDNVLDRFHILSENSTFNRLVEPDEWFSNYYIYIYIYFFFKIII